MTITHANIIDVEIVKSKGVVRITPLTELANDFLQEEYPDIVTRHGITVDQVRFRDLVQDMSKAGLNLESNAYLDLKH